MANDTHDESPPFLLYVRSACMVCSAKSYSCPYCNGEGREYIEAADQTIGRWIRKLDGERKENILRIANKSPTGKEDG